MVLSIVKIGPPEGTALPYITPPWPPPAERGPNSRHDTRSRRIGSLDASAASPQVVSAVERSRIAVLCCSAAVWRRRLAAPPGTHRCPAWRMRLKDKNLRRRCASESCRKVFRHADPAARVCSPACRQRVYRVRRKAAEEAEQQRVQAERRDQVATLLARMKARPREQPAPEPSEPAASEPAPQPRRGYLPTTRMGLMDDTPRPITIVIPRRPPITPLNRGR